jgi:integrase
MCDNSKKQEEHMRHKKPYRLYLRKTGYYFYRLPGQPWKTTGKKEHDDAVVFVRELLKGAGSAPALEPGQSEEVAAARSTLLRDYALPAFERYVEGKRRAAGKKGRQLSESYVVSIRNYLKRIFTTEADPLGSRPLGAITVGDFQSFQDRLLEKLAEQRTTAVRILEAVRLVLRRAEKLGHIERSPDRAVEVAQEEGRSRTTYTDAELDALFPADVWAKNDFTPWKGLFDYTAGILAASTGMRRCEVLGVVWEAVHLEPGREYIEIRGSAQPGGRLGPTKGRRPRACPVFDFVLWPERRAVKALAELRRRMVSAVKVVGMDGEPLLEGPVFSLMDGHRFGPTWWSKHFRQALGEAKINRERGEDYLPLDAHALRHSLASRLKAAGLPDDLIRRFCGWASVSVEERYTHIDASTFGRVMELIRATENR